MYYNLSESDYAMLLKLGYFFEMTVFIYHAEYRSSIPSGENRTVSDIADLISEFENVFVIKKSSDLLVQSFINKVLTIIRVFNPFAPSQIKKVYKPGDYVQIHQAFPVFTLSEMIFVKRRKIPTFRVIHNYRMSCLSGNHFRNGSSCHKCKFQSYNSGIYFGCYNNNKFYSFAISIYTRLLNSFSEKIECNFVAISTEIENYIRTIGISENRIHTILNFTSPLKLIAKSAKEVVFIGRMEQEKGVLNLVNVWKSNPQLPNLHLIGSGFLDKIITNSIQSNQNIKFHGHCSAMRVEEIASNCKVAIFLNLWAEPFGRVLVEAMSRGQYIITTAPNILSEMLDPKNNGNIITPNPEEILEAVQLALLVDSKLHMDANPKIWNANYSRESARNKWKQLLVPIDKELNQREGIH